MSAIPLVTLYFNRPISVDGELIIELSGKLKERGAFGVTLVHGLDGEYEDLFLDSVLDRIRLHR